MRAVQPTFIKLDQSKGDVRLSFEVMDLKVIAVFVCSYIAFRKCTLHIMPPFSPNEEMLERHADKGREDWEIYAWCVRNAMAKCGNFEERENNVLKERLDYYEFIMRRKDVIEAQGKKFYADRLAYQELDDECVPE